MTQEIKTNLNLNIMKNQKPQIVFIAICGAYFILNCLFSCAGTQRLSQWDNDIRNKDNFEFVSEIAFNKKIKISDVTQEQFNKRYLKQQFKK